jgi:hypothetical protein
LFVVGRSPYILLSNTKSLSSTVLPGKGMGRFTLLSACGRVLLESYVRSCAGPTRSSTAAEEPAAIQSSSYLPGNRCVSPTWRQRSQPASTSASIRHLSRCSK